MNAKAPTVADFIPEEEVFFEKWSARNLPDLAGAMASPALPAVYGFAVPDDMKKLLDRVRLRKPDEAMRETMLYDYWHARAKRILEGYCDYRRPVLDYDRLTPIAYESINLLSAEGKRLLAGLEAGARLPIAALKSAAKKDELDLSLFIDMDPMIDGFEVSMGYPIMNGLKQNINKFACISGCMNGCSVCAEMSQPYIHCMPFPIYLKVLSRFKDFPVRTEANPVLHVVQFDDSDPLFYFDPVIGADMGDLYRRADNMDIMLDCCTRGFAEFGGVAELAMRKKFYSKLSPYADISVLFCGEGAELDRNLHMVDNLLKVHALYPDAEKFNLCITASGRENLKDNFHRLKQLENTASVGHIIIMRLTPMGRARSAEIKDDMRDLPGYLEGAYYRHGEIQLDAYGRVFKKLVGEGVVEREYWPVDIYGRTVDKPDYVRRSCLECAGRYIACGR